MMKDTYKFAFKNTGKAFMWLLFYSQQKCMICSREGDVICNNCADKFPHHQARLCVMCGRQIKNEGLCRNCKKHTRPYEQGIIALFYEDKPKEIMSDFKFHSQRQYADFFAKEIYKKIKEQSIKIDIIASVPMHPIKLFAKGYNPPTLIAKKLSRIMDVQYCRSALKRKRYTKSMSRLKNIDRMEHSKKNFAKGKGDVSGKKVLLVDDVSTTGATLHVCAEILLDKNADRVFVAAACGDSSLYVE